MTIDKNDPIALLRWARGCVPYPSDCHAAIEAFLINPDMPTPQPAAPKGFTTESIAEINKKAIAAYKAAYKQEAPPPDAIGIKTGQIQVSATPMPEAVEKIREKLEQARKDFIYHKGMSDRYADKHGTPFDEALALLPTLASSEAVDDRATIADYEATLADHRRLVRELDVALNGEENAAQQASLCDIVHQVKHEGIKARPAMTQEPGVVMTVTMKDGSEHRQVIPPGTSIGGGDNDLLTHEGREAVHEWFRSLQPPKPDISYSFSVPARGTVSELPDYAKPFAEVFDALAGCGVSVGFPPHAPGMVRFYANRTNVEVGWPAGERSQAVLMQVREALRPFAPGSMFMYDHELDRICITREVFNGLNKAAVALAELEKEMGL